MRNLALPTCSFLMMLYAALFGSPVSAWNSLWQTDQKALLQCDLVSFAQPEDVIIISFCDENKPSTGFMVQL